jgi:hypothetical protein
MTLQQNLTVTFTFTAADGQVLPCSLSADKKTIVLSLSPLHKQPTLRMESQFGAVPIDLPAQLVAWHAKHAKSASFTSATSGKARPPEGGAASKSKPPSDKKWKEVKPTKPKQQSSHQSKKKANSKVLYVPEQKLVIVFTIPYH